MTTAILGIISLLLGAAWFFIKRRIKNKDEITPEERHEENEKNIVGGKGSLDDLNASIDGKLRRLQDLPETRRDTKR